MGHEAELGRQHLSCGIRAPVLWCARSWGSQKSPSLPRLSLALLVPLLQRISVGVLVAPAFDGQLLHWRLPDALHSSLLPASLRAQSLTQDHLWLALWPWWLVCPRIPGKRFGHFKNSKVSTDSRKWNLWNQQSRNVHIAVLQNLRPFHISFTSPMAA